jgi:hypothetical protein
VTAKIKTTDAISNGVIGNFKIKKSERKP